MNSDRRRSDCTFAGSIFVWRTDMGSGGNPSNRCASAEGNTPYVYVYRLPRTRTRRLCGSPRPQAPTGAGWVSEMPARRCQCHETLTSCCESERETHASKTWLRESLDVSRLVMRVKPTALYDLLEIFCYLRCAARSPPHEQTDACDDA